MARCPFLEAKTYDRERVSDVSECNAGARPGSGRALVEVMEPFNLRGFYDTPERGRVYLSRPGRVVVKRLMGPHGVVVGDVAMQEPAKMGLA